MIIRYKLSANSKIKASGKRTLMEALPTEWEYTADVAGWINQILTKNPRLPFSEAKCERRTVGSQKRRDITLLDKNKVVALTGEVKLPYKPDGGSPYNEAVVQDARKKAKRAKAERSERIRNAKGRKAIPRDWFNSSLGRLEPLPT